MIARIVAVVGVLALVGCAGPAPRYDPGLAGGVGQVVGGVK